MKFISKKIDYNEYSVLYIVFITCALFIHLLSIFLPDGISEAEEGYIYYLFFGAGPLIVYLIYRLTNSPTDSEVSPVNQILFFLNGYLIVFFSVYHLSLAMTTKMYSRWYFSDFSRIQIISTASILVLNYFSAKIMNKLCLPAVGIGNKLLILIAPLVLFVLFLTDHQKEIIHAVSSSLDFQKGCIIGFLISMLIIISSNFSIPRVSYLRIASKIVSTLVTILAILFIFSLFDTSLTVDGHHFDAYMGSAMAVHGGWIPFVDIHNQYGLLPFMLVAWLFKIVPPSYVAMAVLVSFTTVLQSLIIFLIIQRLTKNKLLLWFGGILLLLFFIVIAPFNVNSRPSTSGFRHLPTFLLLLTLVYLPKGRKANVFTLIALLLCAFWSIDQFFYGAITYSALLLGNGLAYKEKIYYFLKSALIALAIPLLAHGIFSLSMFLYYGFFPRYDLYWEVIMTFVTGFWLSPVNPNNLTFGFHLLIYSAVLVYSLRAILERDRAARERDWDSIKSVFVVAIMGIFHMQYFVGRSYDEEALIIYSMPLGIIFLVMTDRFLEWRKVMYFTNIIGWIIIVVIFSLSAGLAVNNVTLPRNFLHSLSYVKKIIFEPPRDEFDREVIKMINKWQAGEKRVLTFFKPDRRIASLVSANKAHRYPITFDDSRYPHKMDQILHTPVNIKEGDVFITDSPPARIIFSDNCGIDNTKNWIHEGDSLIFDKDHYKFATSADAKHIFRIGIPFTKDKLYRVSVDVKGGTASNSTFDIYLNDGAINTYSPPATAGNEWGHHTYSFRSGTTTPNGCAGIRVLPSLAGKNIEIKNFSVVEIATDISVDAQRGSWFIPEGLEPVDAKLEENIISQWDCRLVDESPSGGIKVYKLTSKRP